MKRIIICIFLVFVLTTTGCNEIGDSNNGILDVKAANLELKVKSSTKNVDEFIKKNIAYNSIYEYDECFNITPNFISENSKYSIFKYSKSCASYLFYENEVYEITGVGAFGVTSMALADLDGDSNYELYFTFSHGSGIHWSLIGYFDPTTNEIIKFQYSYMDNDMILTTNDGKELNFCQGIFEGDSFVDYTMKSEKSLGKIIGDAGEIKLDMLEE